MSSDISLIPRVTAPGFAIICGSTLVHAGSAPVGVLLALAGLVVYAYVH